MSLVIPHGQLDQFFLLSRDLFCCIDIKGTLLQVNPAFETLLGYKRESLGRGGLNRRGDHRRRAGPR